MATSSFDLLGEGEATFFKDPRRKAPRRAVRIPGEVSFGDRTKRLTCQIVDMSATGARLRMQDQLELLSDGGKPRRNRIGLYFDQRTVNVECQVIWVMEAEVGVQFCSMLNHGNRQQH